MPFQRPPIANPIGLPLKPPPTHQNPPDQARKDHRHTLEVGTEVDGSKVIGSVGCSHQLETYL